MKVFKKSMLALVLLSAFSCGSSPSARAADLADASGQAFWSQVGALISGCAVRTYTIQDGQKTYGALQPTCNDLRVDDQGAQLLINGVWYTARLEEAQDSDDGDLDNVSVYDPSGRIVAQRTEVLAFGDVLLALDGGRAQVPELYVGH